MRWVCPRPCSSHLRYFPLRQALRLPVLVSHRVWLQETGSSVHVHDTRRGRIKIGFGEVGIFDQQRARSIWQVSGRVEFKGRCHLGHGSKISIPGELVLGDDFRITAESAIVAHHRVVFGDDVRISWDVLVMVTDLHGIYDAHERPLNPPPRPSRSATMSGSVAAR
jgi:hypothetical protein